MPDVNRRKVLKTMAVAGSASAIPFTAKAATQLLQTTLPETGSLKPLPLYIDVQLGRSSAKQSTEIVNHGDKPLTLTGFSPASFKSVNGQVSVNLKTPELPYTLKPGESLPVYAEAVSASSARKTLPVVPTIASESIAIRTENASVNGELIITVFDSQLV